MALIPRNQKINDVVNTYDEITSVASGSFFDLVTYTVPVGKTFYLQEIEVSGNNKAVYVVKISATIEAKKRTWWTKFNEEFKFHCLKIDAGQTVEVEVEHSSSTVGAFEGRIVGMLL